jgi:hypothetical protein
MILLNYSTFRAAFATGSTLANDGLEVWPVANLRASGFNGGFSGISVPVLAFPLTISCNAQANDPLVSGKYTNSYNWYLRQRTDDAASQVLSLTQHSAAKSGTVLLNRSALGLSLYPTVNFDSVIGLFRHTELYVQRLSDKAIQFVDLVRAVTEA